MDLGIRGKLAVVTGGSKSLGRAVATELAAEGCRVVAIARSRLDLEAVSRITGGDHFAADLTDDEGVQAAIHFVESCHGSPDIIVHAAGGSADARDLFGTADDYLRAWRLNLGAALELNRTFIPRMVKRGWGRVVHFSSNGVSLSIGHAPYTSAKAAVEGYVSIAGRQLAAKGVVLTAVQPGPFDNGYGFIYRQNEAWTRQFQEHYVPARRWGRPEECARLVAFLCSRQASYMAGAVVPVDAGMR